MNAPTPQEQSSNNLYYKVLYSADEKSPSITAPEPSPTTSDAYTPEEIARLAQVGAGPVWDDLTTADQLDYILHDDNPKHWWTPEYLSVLGHFRHNAIRWPEIKTYAQALKIFPPDLEGAVDRQIAIEKTVRDAETPDAPAPPPPADTPVPTLNIMSARDLFYKELPPLRYVVDTILPAGATLCYGKSKSGKSLAAWDISVAVATGGKALGHFPVEQGRALYLALEDGERRAQTRLRQHLGDAPPPDNLDIVVWDAPRLGEGLEACLVQWLDAHPDARLITIDILEKVRPRRTRGGSVYQDDYNALASLVRLAQDYNVAILVIHHANKARVDDHRDSASGSMSLTGAADTLWSLERMAGEATAVLHVTGRDIIEEQKLALKFDAGFWTVLGDADEVRLGETAQDILEALREAGRPLAPVDVAKRLGIDRNTIKRSIGRMVDRGQLLSTGSGQYVPGKPTSRSHKKELSSDGSETKSVPTVPGIPTVPGVPTVPAWAPAPDERVRNGYDGYAEQETCVPNLSTAKSVPLVPGGTVGTPGTLLSAESTQPPDAVDEVPMVDMAPVLSDEGGTFLAVGRTSTPQCSRCGGQDWELHALFPATCRRCDVAPLVGTACAPMLPVPSRGHHGTAYYFCLDNGDGGK